MSNLSTLEKIGIYFGVLGFVIASINVYYTHFYGPDVVVEFFPKNGMGAVNVNDKLDFSFLLYNRGNKNAFIDTIIVECSDSDSYYMYPYGTSCSPGLIYIAPGETEEIKITLHPPMKKYYTWIKLKIYLTDNKSIETDSFLVTWGYTNYNPEEYNEMRKALENWEKEK